MTSLPTPAPSPASDPNAKQLEAKALATRHRDALRVRARRIRRTVISTALALFTAAFIGIYVQLASGHDPALSAASKRASAATTKLASSESSNTTTTGESGTSGESTDASESSESGTSASAVTTSQS